MIRVTRAEIDAGARVAYTAYPGATPEFGTITSTNHQFVFVRYDGDNGSKATRREDLHWAAEAEGKR